jgi:exosortase D (VPLPA-CTERM-specific)
LIACHAPLLAGLARQWSSDPDMSHGFFVLPVVAYVGWRRRAELAEVAWDPNPWGLALAGWGAAQMLLGTLGAQVFIARTSILISMVGAVLLVAGTRALKILAYPLLLMLFLFPIPAIVYAHVTLPLQIFASATAETVLSAIGIPVFRDGNILELAHERLSVVEACSGIRSLLSLSFLSLVYAYFFDRRVAMRWILLGATIPIAIVANAARVTFAGILSEYRTDLAHGVFHLLEGWVLFVVALGLIVLTHRLVRGSVGQAKPDQGVRHGRGVPPQGWGTGRWAAVLGALLLVQGAVFYGISLRAEPTPVSKPLSAFPAVLGRWHMEREGVIDQDERDTLRADDYLSRQYAGSSGQSANLFVAYFRSQRTGQTPHSPKNCLPGSGWAWSVSDTLRLQVAGRAQPIDVNRYIVSRGDEHAVVLYWYQSQDRVVANEYQAAAFTAWDALRYNRTDTALVRVVTPVTRSGIEFIQASFTELRRYNQGE